jgi:hypothetical protein
VPFAFRVAPTERGGATGIASACLSTDRLRRPTVPYSRLIMTQIVVKSNRYRKTFPHGPRPHHGRRRKVSGVKRRRYAHPDWLGQAEPPCCSGAGTVSPGPPGSANGGRQRIGPASPTAPAAGSDHRCHGAAATCCLPELSLPAGCPPPPKGGRRLALLPPRTRLCGVVVLATSPLPPTVYNLSPDELQAAACGGGAMQVFRDIAGHRRV